MMTAGRRQLGLPGIETWPGREADVRINRIDASDRAIHDWYRFVLAFPPHLVRHYLEEFGLDARHTVLDPFCGTGTTLVEARLGQIGSVGTEANPFAHFASSVKVDWGVDPDTLVASGYAIADQTRQELARQGIDDNHLTHSNNGHVDLKELDPAAARLLIRDSVSPLPLHKTLVLMECLRAHRGERVYGHLALALANALVYSISNLRFGPEVGVGELKPDTPVIAPWLAEITKMAADLGAVMGHSYPQAAVHLADARALDGALPARSVDAVITSPPYPNEKDYTRTTRLESVILGLINSLDELRVFKKHLVRSNTRVVCRGDDDDRYVVGNPEVQRIAEEIERRRIELGKTSGFERMYARVTRLYFGGMARHLAELRPILRPGAWLAYVVGDQASYLRVMIRTGQILGSIAQELGYEWVRTDLFRTRFATETREQLREEVVILRWTG